MPSISPQDSARKRHFLRRVLAVSTAAAPRTFKSNTMIASKRRRSLNSCHIAGMSIRYLPILFDPFGDPTRKHLQSSDCRRPVERRIEMLGYHHHVSISEVQPLPD